MTRPSVEARIIKAMQQHIGAGEAVDDAEFPFEDGLNVSAAKGTDAVLGERPSFDLLPESIGRIIG
jgi:hypothetical protein